MKSISRVTSILLTLFVLIIATLGVLKVFGVISVDQLTDNAAKIGGSLFILVIATAVISWVQSQNQ